VFVSGQWRTPEAAERHRAKRYPCNDPDVPHPGMVFYSGCWRDPERAAAEKQRRALTKRSGRHRKHLGDVCERCGFVPTVPAQMDVHHRDGDHSNNDPANLETVCANCHRLEHATTQRAALAADPRS
jgi:5-methylcytosine-specific restriction endonuclease McrA